ncbi:hypothetical protein TS85_01380 [Sphingomonas hengshuiensis]|uniref:Autotransporter domain-containing protein n=1 Tax=Sphingomonas hengshuiensis TaxID=1609977 RepID=A0A7U5BEE5_9SPHN|nr:hypothetical protein TS85_01380 [Sphingomonas hengshuiensis]
MALVLAAAAACAGAGSAQAQTTLDESNSPVQIDGGATSITVTSGTNAVVLPNYASPGVEQGWITIPDNGLVLDYANSILSSPASSSPFGGASTGAQINVESGATLTFAGVPTLGYGQWVAFNNLIRASGDVVIENTGGNSINLAGANSFLGNLTLEAGAQLNTGQTWGAPVQLTFGANSNVTLGAGAQWFINQGTNTATIGGRLSAADSTATVNLSSGTLVVNGQNTTASPFRGTLTIGAGATFVVGDSTHSSAIFGDPNYVDGSGLTINVVRNSTGTPATLQGYGTIYAAVNNASGIVQPGGTAGTLGTLTVGSYTQGATGILNVEVSPTGASQLKVLGAASLSGTLNITVDAGEYGNAVYTVLSAQSISGEFSNIVTSGNTSGAIVGLQVTSTSYSLVTESTESTQIISHLSAANRDHIKLFTGALYDTIATTSESYGAPRQDYGRGVSLWMAPIGQRSNVRSGNTGYRADAYGGIGGFELALPHKGKLGIAASYTSGSIDTRSGTAQASVDTLDLAVYGGLEFQNARIDGIAFYNRYDATADRQLEGYGTISSSPKGISYGGSLQLSRGIFDNAVVPFLRGTYSFHKQKGVVEAGGDALSLAFDEIRLHSFVANAGLKIHPVAPIGKVKLRPEITLAVEHDFSNPGEYVTGSFATITGSPFSYYWSGNTQTAGVGSIDLTALLSPRLAVFGRVDGRFTSRQDSEAASLGLRLRF